MGDRALLFLLCLLVAAAFFVGAFWVGVRSRGWRRALGVVLVLAGAYSVLAAVAALMAF